MCEIYTVIKKTYLLTMHNVKHKVWLKLF